MAAALAGCRMALLGTGWTISHLVSTNGQHSSPPVGALYLVWVCRQGQWKGKNYSYSLSEEAEKKLCVVLQIYFWT